MFFSLNKLKASDLSVRLMVAPGESNGPTRLIKVCRKCMNGWELIAASFVLIWGEKRGGEGEIEDLDTCIYIYL